MNGLNMPKKTKKNEVFLLTFIGEFVQVVSSFVMNVSSNGEDMGESPLIVEGYLLDMDDDFIYMGDSPDGITRALKKDTVVFIQFLNNEDILSSLLDNYGNNGKSKKDLN